MPDAPTPERTVGIADAALRYLPHSGPAHLVPKVLDSCAEYMICVGRFPLENPLVEDGRVSTFLAVEPAAQAAATHLALLAVADGVVLDQMAGFLTGMKNTVIHQQWLPAETDIEIRVKPRGGSRGLYRYRFEVKLHGACVCEGELSTFVHTQLKQ